MLPTVGRLARILALSGCLHGIAWAQAVPSAPLPDGAAAPQAASGDGGSAATTPPAETPAPSAAPAHRREHGHRTPAQVLDDQVKALAKELQLTPDQQRKARDVLIQQRVALLELRRNGAQDKVAASHAVFQRARDEMRALLTPEQRLKYFVDPPEEQLAPAQVDRDFWLNASRAKPAAQPPAGAQAAAGQPGAAHVQRDPPAVPPGVDRAK